MRRLRNVPWVAAVGLLALVLPPGAGAMHSGHARKGRHPGLDHGDYRGGGGRHGSGDHDGDDDHHGDKGHGRERPVRIVLEEAATSVWDDGHTVGTQMLLRNDGGREAHDVRVTRVRVKGGAYQGPAALPRSLGDLDGGEDAMLDALLSVGAPDGRQRMLVVMGDYREGRGRGRHRFVVHRRIAPDAAPPESIASTPGLTVKSDPLHVDYPPSPTAPPFGPNAESPIFVPLGPPRQLFPPTPTGTALGTSAGGAGVTIPRNTSMRTAGVPPDPNAAAEDPDGVVLAAYNTGISYSTDGGQHFTDVNLTSPQPGNPSRTSFFPQSDGGLCCDQVVVYLPREDLFVWLLQYNPVVSGTTITTPDRLRIAWAKPEAIVADFWNAWTYADLTANSVPGVSDGLGVPSNEWLDYPDLAWSDTFLYVGVDHGYFIPGKVYTGRRLVARLSLADIADTAASVVHYDWAELSGSNGLNKTHFVQGAPGRMVVGSLDNSSTLRVFTWPDTEGSISNRTVGISQIKQGGSYTSVAPDGADWVAVSFPGNITGATFRNVQAGLDSPPRPEYLFAFDAGVNGTGRPRAYVRLETLTASGDDYSVSEEYDVWNPDYAFAMAALGSDGSEIGITLAVGGGTVGYPQESVGYKNDFVVYQVTNSNATQITRFGDYFCNRLVPGPGALFAAETYDVVLRPLPPGVTSGTCATVGCDARMRFVEYGRPPVIIK